MPVSITVSLTVTTKGFGGSSSTTYFYILVLSLLMTLFIMENILNRGQVLKILQPAMINVAVFSGFKRHGPIREKQRYQRSQETRDSYFGSHWCGRQETIYSLCFCEYKNSFSAEWLRLLINLKIRGSGLILTRVHPWTLSIYPKVPQCFQQGNWYGAFL